MHISSVLYHVGGLKLAMVGVFVLLPALSKLYEEITRLRVLIS